MLEFNQDQKHTAHGFPWSQSIALCDLALFAGPEDTESAGWDE